MARRRASPGIINVLICLEISAAEFGFADDDGACDDETFGERVGFDSASNFRDEQVPEPDFAKIFASKRKRAQRFESHDRLPEG